MFGRAFGHENRVASDRHLLPTQVIAFFRQKATDNRPALNRFHLDHNLGRGYENPLFQRRDSVSLQLAMCSALTRSLETLYSISREYCISGEI